MEISEKFGKSLVDKSVFLVLWKNWKNSASRLQTPVTMESIGNSQFKGKYGFWNVEFKLFFSIRFVCLPFPLWGEGAESALPTCNQNPSVNMNSKIEARIKELWRVMFAFCLGWSSYFQDSTLLYYTPLLSGYRNLDNQCRDPTSNDKECRVEQLATFRSDFITISDFDAAPNCSHTVLFSES